MKIAIDTFGGDNAPQAQIDGALQVQKEKDIELVFLGDEEKITQYLKDKDIQREKIQIIHCTQQILDTDKPVKAIREKKNSPMVVGCKMLKDDEVDAFVSSGNTGALLTAGTLVTGRIRGIDRPALMIPYPTKRGTTLLLDVGANASCKSINLAQFAVMASTYAEKVLEIENPKVGLVNIGSEETKGSPLYIESYQMLKEIPDINFVGNIEAREVPKGQCDVIVCDGFTGNIILKLTEGLVMNLTDLVKQQIMSSFTTKIGGLLIKPAMKKIKDKMSHDKVGGAVLLGAKKAIVKAHGSSSAYAFSNSVKLAIKFNESNALEIISEYASQFKKIPKVNE